MNMPLARATVPHLYGSVKVGERGQVVIPQDARAEMGLRAGDKLLALGGIPGMQGVVFVKAESFGMFLAEITQKMSALEKLMRVADAEAGTADADRRVASAPHRTKRSRV